MGNTRLMWKNRLTRVAGLAIAGAGMLLGVTACAGGPGGPSGPPPCPPPAYSLSAESVTAGGTLRVSAPEATCNPSYGNNAQIEIQLVDSKHKVIETKLAPMTDTGSFNYQLTVPSTLRAGTYSISALPHDLDWCDDTGVNNRLKKSSIQNSSVVVVRASCVTPFKDFKVTK